MSELVVLEKETALSVLTGENGVALLIDHVRDQVMSLEGGNLKTDAGRKKIKSNAFKATKAKTNANKVIDDLIQQNKDAIEQKTKVEVATIEKLKQSKKELGAGLDKIRADVNAEVQAIEDAIKAEQEAIAAAEEAERRRIEIENCLELAHYMNADFDRQKADRLEQEREEQEAREEQLRKEGEEKAKAEALAREEAAKAEAEQAKIREQQAIEQARIDAENAEIQRKKDAEMAEKRRLADIEAAKLAEAERIENERLEQERIAQARAEDVENKRKVNNEILGDLIVAGLTEEQARLAIKAMAKKQVRNVRIIY